MESAVVAHSLLTDFDIYLFKSGKHFKIYEKLGSHLVEKDGVQGTHFAVWSPNAKSVSVVGVFNDWDKSTHLLYARGDSSGIWEGFIPEVGQGTLYKYAVQTFYGSHLLKGDPYARRWEMPPQTASIVWNTNYTWGDSAWMQTRREKAGTPQPMATYEVHLGSWKKLPYDGNRSLNYTELAEELVQYVKNQGFTHVEFLPVMEHPFYGSWGYQVTGYFAPSSRYGSPEEMMYLIDAFHRANIGVILDWVPSHFPGDAHGLFEFDGTSLYEHADPRKGFHPDWKSYIFNYGRNEVRSFLISNAVFWAEQYHADGLRVDAVASMLYLDYSRKQGEWIPNQYGGNENLEAVSFLREFNEVIHKEYPDVLTIAEESTAWSGVSRPTSEGGLGFDQKWMMGWMHDTLRYIQRDPIYRKHHQNEITFSIVYAFTENFMLPFSHDEVVHGKGPLLDRMTGDDWRRYAGLRELLAYQWTHPGTKLLFMGCEFGQTTEWAHDKGLDWHVLSERYPQGILALMRDLNHLYKTSPALYKKSFSPEGFEWIAYDDNQNSVIAYLRKGEANDKPILVVCNFTPNVVQGYGIGVPVGGAWREILNTDTGKYGGSNVTNDGELVAVAAPLHGKEQHIIIRTAPLSVMVFEPVNMPIASTILLHSSFPQQVSEEQTTTVVKRKVVVKRSKP